jgi:hypothetical protein
MIEPGSKKESGITETFTTIVAQISWDDVETFAFESSLALGIVIVMTF